ncbi:hypothetical protein, partial [Shouchella clausii]
IKKLSGEIPQKVYAATNNDKVICLLNYAPADIAIKTAPTTPTTKTAERIFTNFAFTKVTPYCKSSLNERN